MGANTLAKEKYLFSASANTVAFYVIDFDIRKVASIVNKSTNQILYAPAMGSGYGGSVSGQVLTLDCSTTGMTDLDLIEVVYDWEAWYHKSHEIDFTAAIASGVDSAQSDLLATGSGMIVAQVGGSLAIAMGSTVNAETIIRSKIPFTREILAGFASRKSQAIANNTCMVMLADKIGDGLAAVASSATTLAVTVPASNPTYEALAAILATSATGLVGQKMFVGALSGVVGVPGQYAIASATLSAGISVVLNFTVAGWTAGSGTVCLFGWNAIYYLETPATATTGSFDCVRNGWPSAVGEASVTVNSSTTGHGIAFYKLADNVVLADTALTSLAIPTDRAGRIDGIPTEETKLYLYIIARNGSTAPASSTTWTIGGIRIEESNAQPALMTGIRIRNGGQSSLPVYFPISPSVTVASGTVTDNVGTVAPTLYADTTTVLAAAAVYTGTSRDGGTTPAYQRFAARAYSDQAGTLYIQDSTDGSTWRTVEAVALAAGDTKTLDVRCLARYHRVYYVNGATLQTAFRIISGYHRI